ncbi:hypothetical protein [Microvirga tunisiensis]|uniref:Uracil-DNA glycosylase-like domain-containing protein n=1 Tax=Microvirga tunisiensis TaxID=2108360 RepID=A0A5N7MAY1_9HYPH|nr:hypothetical protein [Microvirga tunisiensis]MPR06296.1 hypothetical protein [Microvirga tunisiensis]MPR24082.1 hypothetical protein [Microvirga tunisiensis]
MENLLPRFAEIIAAASQTEIQSDPSLGGHLVLDRQDPFCVTYAPFDYVNSRARVVLVGLTPGRQQAVNALLEARRQLVAGHDIDAASKAAKETASFSGPMRQTLVDMLDHVGLNRCLGMKSCQYLFGTHAGLVHYTSALRYPVYLKGANYSGSSKVTTHPMLRRYVSECLAAEVSQLRDAVWIPMGPWSAAALSRLVREGKLDHDKVLDGLPHPSPANAERSAYFLGRKAKAHLSVKTNPDLIDTARAKLISRVASLVC